MFEIIRLCLGEEELGKDSLVHPNNTCSSEPLEGGKREFCLCEGNFCNEEKESLPDVCDGHSTQGKQNRTRQRIVLLIILFTIKQLLL